MKVASWNINSVRARADRLAAWLDRSNPDVVCLQEIKTVDTGFPFELATARGYEVAVYGQKTYNGVAILSRRGLDDVQRGFDDGSEDPEARLIGARVDGVHVFSVYVPNGTAVGSERYAYKIDWLGRLRTLLERRFAPGDPVVLCGDFNVAPEDRDVAHPDQWAQTVLCHEDARGALRHLVAWGLQDTLRVHTPDSGVYSWWDYRALAFPRNDGLRIDQIWATNPVASRLTSAYVDRDERKGEKPSDHAPIFAVFDVQP